MYVMTIPNPRHKSEPLMLAQRYVVSQAGAVILMYAQDAKKHSERLWLVHLPLVTKC